MKLPSKIALITIFLGVLASSCKKEACQVPAPEMEFMDFYQIPDDSVNYKLVFKFSDCDGDIGMATTSTIVDEFGETQTTNFKLDLYYLVDGVWSKYILAFEEGLNSKIPILSDENESAIEDGEIEKTLHKDFSLGGHDSILFRSRILDNAGHYSEEVETPVFYIPQ